MWDPGFSVDMKDIRKVVGKVLIRSVDQLIASYRC